ncbi:MAG: hypothetical protein ACI9JN_001253 [Bacteroidia bacterium]|jgi:hypothetical protein
MTKYFAILLLFSVSYGTTFSQTGDTVDMYYYKNSLHNHLETGNSEANSSTNVGNWIARFTATPSNPKMATLGSVFGFFPQWSVPPRANNFHAEITTPHLEKWTAAWADAEEIDLLGFVPDNFDGQSFDPSDTTNMGEAYVTKLLFLIDAWESNAANTDRRYVVYAGWPALNRYGGTNDDPGTLTPSGIANWHSYGLGDYQDWMELLVSQLQDARPALDIRLNNISKAVLMCHQNTVVKDMEATALFEDLAPHGRATWYFLAAVAEYIEVFGEKPPANFEFKSEWFVDSTVTSNYQPIVDYIWSVLKGGSSSVAPDAMPDLQLTLFPNPANETVEVNTSESAFEICVYNALGQIVVHQESKHVIDVHQLSPGTYYVEVMSKSNLRRGKFVVSEQ